MLSSVLLRWKHLWFWSFLSHLLTLLDWILHSWSISHHLKNWKYRATWEYSIDYGRSPTTCYFLYLRAHSISGVRSWCFVSQYLDFVLAYFGSKKRGIMQPFFVRSGTRWSKSAQYEILCFRVWISLLCTTNRTQKVFSAWAYGWSQLLGKEIFNPGAYTQLK